MQLHTKGTQMTIPKRVVYVRENQAGKPLKAALTPRGVDATGYATHTYVPLAPIDRLLAEVRRHCTEVECRPGDRVINRKRS